jgi:hypothetical protein
MQNTLGPYVTAGIAIVGASLIAVTPVTAPPPGVQQRVVKLVDYVEYDAAQLASATEANWQALESILNSSHWISDPDISQGLSVLFTDLSNGTSNAVTSPVSLLAEGSLALLSMEYASNAASNALAAVTDNVESALGDGNYTLAFTDLENAGTTVLYAFLNGYSENLTSSLISPEFGLLTNTVAGAATGQLDALAQISNTIADEIANLGGANLTTTLPDLVTGQLNLSVSISQILSDLGLSDNALTINGILGDLGIPTDTDILPSLTVGDVLGYLGIEDSSGISLGTILGDLGLNDASGISLGAILSDLGLNDDAGITLGTVLNGLGLTDSSGISLGSILSDLGLNDNAGISLGTILGDLGITGDTITPPSISIPISSILSELGLTDTSGDITLSVPSLSIPVSTILTDLGINPTGTVGISVNVPIVGHETIQVPVSTILSALGINTSGSIGLNIPSLSIPVTTILNDLGITNTSGDLTFQIPSISLNSILGDLGLSTDSTLSINNVLEALGLSDTSSLNIGDILSGLGLSDSTSLGLSTILSDLGLSSTSSFNIGDILSGLGLSDDSGLTLGNILSDLGLGTDTVIPLPSLSIDGILGDLGINPDENILTLLGIPDTLSLDPSIGLDGGVVATYVDDLAKDLLAAVGSIAPIAQDLPALLGTDPAVDLISALSGLFTDLDLPVTVSGSLSVDLTSIVAELLPGLF